MGNQPTWEELTRDPAFDIPEATAVKLLEEHRIPKNGSVGVVHREVPKSREVGGAWKRHYTLTTTFPEKGNKKLIDELRVWGWDVLYRQKERTDSGSTRNQYAGYMMMVKMRFIVKIVEEEADCSAIH